MKDEYVRIIENDPTKKARAVLERIGDLEYEIVKFDIPTGYTDGEVGEQLLKEITDDADSEGVTLHADINRIMTKE